MLRRVLSKGMMERADAEDLIQNVLLRVVRSIDNGENPHNYIQRATTRAMANHKRDMASSNRKLPVSNVIDGMEDPNYEQVEDFFTCDPKIEETVMNKVHVNGVLKKMDDYDRELLIDHYYRGHTTREIAEDQGCAQKTVQKHLRRARDKFEEIAL